LLYCGARAHARSNRADAGISGSRDGTRARVKGDGSAARIGGAKKSRARSPAIKFWNADRRDDTAPSRGEQLKIRFRREDGEGTNTSAEVYMHPHPVQNKKANCKSAMQYPGYFAQTVTSS
jgi:hypothetical protein